MQRLGELNNKVIVEQKTAPENKYVIWKDPVEGKFKEYKDGSWVESEEIAVPGSGGDFPYEYIKLDDINVNVSEITWDQETESVKKYIVSTIDFSFVNLPDIVLCSTSEHGERYEYYRSYIGGSYDLDIYSNNPGSTSCNLKFADNKITINITNSKTVSSWGPEDIIFDIKNIYCIFLKK